MSGHLLIATMKPIEGSDVEKYDIGILSLEDYYSLPFTLPYIYEMFGYEKLAFLRFCEEWMEYGDVVEVYEYWDGKKVLPESINVPEEARTINLLKCTYKDEYGEYHLSKKNWVKELEHRTVISNRSVTTIVKY